MAVMIEDKDVPKNCAHCWHHYNCNYYKRDYLMLEKYADYKPDNCPIHEVKTGRWIPCKVSSGRDSWQCSVCGRRARGKVENLPYCHCGAKMKEGEVKE